MLNPGLTGGKRGRFMRTMWAMIAMAPLAVACDGSLNHIIGIGTSGGGGPATHLVFQVQPSNAAAGAAIAPAVQVAAKDASGITDTSYVNNVSITIGADPGLGSLSGNTTLAAVKGVATFSNLSI